MNTTVPIVKITSLQTNQSYRFFVVSRNAAGTSLPSSIVTLNITASSWTGKPVPGAASPPHRLQVESHSATWLQFVWNPPAVSHPEDRLKFRSVRGGLLTYFNAICIHRALRQTRQSGVLGTGRGWKDSIFFSLN